MTRNVGRGRGATIPHWMTVESEVNFEIKSQIPYQNLPVENFDDQSYRKSGSNEVIKSQTNDRRVRKDDFSRQVVPAVGVICSAEVVKIESYGAFVKLLDAFNHMQGLIHISQIAKEKIENVADILSIGQEVFVKVVNVEIDDMSRRTKLSLSMKYCSQSDGTDKDPQGIDSEAEQRRRSSRMAAENLGPLQLGQ